MSAHPGTSLFAGLVKSIGKNARVDHETEVANAQRDKENRLRVLEEASKSPDLTDDEREHIWQELHAVIQGKPGKPAKDVPLQGKIGPLINAVDQEHGGAATAPPPGPSTAQTATSPAATATAAPATAAPAPAPISSGVTPPPAPPRMTLTSAQRNQRQIDNIIAQKQAEADFSTKNKAQQVQDIVDEAAKRGVKIDDTRMQRIIEQVHNVKITGGAVHYGKDSIPTEQIPEGAVDAHTGEVIDKSKVKNVREVYEGTEFKGYTVAAQPKPTARQQRMLEKVDDWKSANPIKAGESADDYAQRGLQSVHQRQFIEDSEKVIGLGLRNQNTRLNMERIKKEIATGNLSYRGALAVWRGVHAAAAQRSRQDIDAVTKPMSELVEDEFQNLGLTQEDVASVLRSAVQTPTKDNKNGGRNSGATPPPPGGSSDNPLNLRPPVR
jgi:hypothetical protein